MIAKVAWEINAICPGKVYEHYEIVDPEGRQVWVGTAAGLEAIRMELAADIERLRSDSRIPGWMLGSLRQLRDRLMEQSLLISQRTA